MRLAYLPLIILGLTGCNLPRLPMPSELHVLWNSSMNIKFGTNHTSSSESSRTWDQPCMSSVGQFLFQPHDFQRI